MRFFAVPLGHKFTAVLLAAAVGGGVYSYYRHNAIQSASTAELSFDMHAARRIDSGLVQAHQPAVIFAQSVLSDQKLADLSKTAYLSTTGMMSRVGEFRSRLVLTQPSAQLLAVRFDDPDPAKAVETANTVANALAAWGPSPNGPAALTEPAPMSAPAANPPATEKPQPPAAETQPPAAKTETPAAKPESRSPKIEAPKPAPPARKATDAGANPSAGSLAAALDALQTQLASTSRQVEEGGSSSRGRAYAQSEQQQLLKSQVRAAEAKVAALRGQATGEDKQRLGAIQQALAAVLAGGGVGVSASQLRREREALTHAMSVLEEQRRAVQKEESAGEGFDPTSDAAMPAGPAQDASSPAKAKAAAPGSGSSAISESDVPGSAASGSGSQAAPAVESLPDGEDATMQNPLHVVRLAGAAATVVWWPAVAAGLGCGLLYWLIAAARQAPAEYEGLEDVSPHYGRFITPDAPVAASVVPAVEPVARDFEDRGGYRRASFAYEPSPEESQTTVEAPKEISPQDPPTMQAAAVDPPAAENEPPLPAEREAALFHEKVVEIDPWADLMQKALSETDIGRKYETPKDRADGAGKDTGPQRPDRLAG